MGAREKGKRVLDIAVVGTGYRAMFHLGTVAKLSGKFRLTAVCDAVSQRADEVAGQFHVNAYTDLERMLNEEKPDVLLITAPPEVHHVMVDMAVRRGVHILCETPISMTMPYANQMIESAKEHRVQLEVAENVWRRPEEQFKRLLIENDVIGELQTARLWYTSGSYHGINALRVLIGSEVVRVTGMAKVFPRSKKKRGIDDFHFRAFAPEVTELPQRYAETTFSTWEAGLLEFDNGVMATYEFPVERNPFGNRWDIHGTKGYISGNQVVLENPDRTLKIVLEEEDIDGTMVPARVRLFEGDQPVDGLVWQNPYAEYKPSNYDEIARIDQLVSIYRAVEEGIPPNYGAVNGAKDVEIMVALRESARLGGSPVNLPIKDVTGYEQRLMEVYK